jgi:hypothetical protein
MEPILKPKRTNETAKKAMQLVHSKKITLKEAWAELKSPTPAPKPVKKSKVINKEK